MKINKIFSGSYFKLAIALVTFFGFSLLAQAQFSGNPLFAGADPEIHYFNNKYYIYTTTVNGKQFHAYSSVDLTNWHDEGVIFDIGPQCTWAENNGWAPGVVYRNNKYYFYYTAEVKIGVAVGNTPVGPFTDLGSPLIGSDPYTQDIIDAMVFTDDDGQSYIYYGGSNGSQMVIRKLNADMISFASGPVNATPQNYTEGPFLLKRKGVYYLMYSNGSWFNDTYNVQYSTSNSPMGPWTYRGRILESNVEDKGPGHHSILKMGDCDEYYIVYHRYENGLGGDRKVAIDRMYFNSSDLIDHVNMTNYGVARRVPDFSCSAQPIVSGGIYRLTHKGTNQCLDVSGNSSQQGANVQQWIDNGNDAQRWIVTLEADGYYKLMHKGTNQCLDVNNNDNQSGANVQQWTDIGSDAQRWKIEVMSDGYCKLTHKGTNQCLDVSGNSNQQGTNVQQWVDNSNDAQRWKFDLIEVPIVSGGIYKLTHKGTNQCLDVSGNSNQSGANVQQYTDNGNDAQRWVITKEADGYYKLTHKGTNQCLDVDNNSNQAGANVAQYTDNASDAQRWKIELVDGGYVKLTHKGTNQCLDVGNNLAEPGTNVAQWVDNGNDAQRWKLDLWPVNEVTNGTGDGLTGNYFNGMNFENAVYSRKDATLSMDWGNGSPNASVPADRFSARWTGQIQPKYSGEYTFYINSDNGRRVWVNNVLIIDQWADNWGTDYTGKVTLTAQQKYDIKVEYFENVGGANIRFEWSSAQQAREVVPTSQLYSNPLPVVTVSSSTTNVTGPANITLSATASDGNGISKVDFYNETTLLGTDNTSPYSYAWNNVAAGTYTVKALATDAKGGVTLSADVTVKVNTVVSNPNVVPTVSLTSPVNNASVNAPATLTLAANASDTDGTISKVEFYNGTQKLGEDASSPYTYSWTNVAAGNYILTAKAYDNSGAVTTSASVTVKVVTVTTDQCAGINTYVENGGYVAGSKVKNTGKRFECKEFPYSGWCNGAAWAYAPGTGAYWTDAWYDRGSCTARMGETESATNEETLMIAPNPASDIVTINLNETSFVSVYNNQGVEVISNMKVDAYGQLQLTSLSSGIYLIRMDTGSRVITQTLIKN